jgi:hypothetical protein
MSPQDDVFDHDDVEPPAGRLAGGDLAQQDRPSTRLHVVDNLRHPPRSFALQLRQGRVPAVRSRREGKCDTYRSNFETKTSPSSR